MKVKSLSHVQLLATPWTAGYQAPPFMGLSQPLATTNHFAVSIGLPFTESHMVGIIQHVAFPE